MDYPSERTNGWNNTYAWSPLANWKTGLSGSLSLLPCTTTEKTPLPAYRPIKFYSDMKPPSFHHPSLRRTTRLPSNGLSKWHEVESRPSKQSIELTAMGRSHLPNSRSVTRYG